MKQASTYLGIGLIALVGCSSGPETSGYDARAFSGEVQLDSCGGQSAPRLPRCGGDAALGIIAAVCGDLTTQNTLTINGSLAVGGQSRFGSPLRVTSCFTGFGGIRADATEEVLGDLSTAADWLVNSPAQVGANALVGGKLYAKNEVAVRGVLHADADMTNVSASFVTEAMAPKNPLNCERAPSPAATIARLEAGAFVDLRDALAAHSEAAHVQLGCATYRFDALGIDNELTLHIKGHTVIIVDGNVRVASSMIVELEPDAQLDFLIGGQLEVEKKLSFTGGSTWLAIAGAVQIAAPMQLDGTLYAPQSDVSSTPGSVDDELRINGALLVGSLHLASPVTVKASSDPPLPACQPSEHQSPRG